MLKADCFKLIDGRNCGQGFSNTGEGQGTENRVNSVSGLAQLYANAVCSQQKGLTSLHR